MRVRFPARPRCEAVIPGNIRGRGNDAVHWTSDGVDCDGVPGDGRARGVRATGPGCRGGALDDAGQPADCADPQCQSVHESLSQPVHEPLHAQFPTTSSNAALFFLAAQQANGGLGSGQLSGVRPSRTAVPAPAPRTASGGGRPRRADAWWRGATSTGSIRPARSMAATTIARAPITGRTFVDGRGDIFDSRSALILPINGLTRSYPQSGGSRLDRVAWASVREGCDYVRGGVAGAWSAAHSRSRGMPGGSVAWIARGWTHATAGSAGSWPWPSSWPCGCQTVKTPEEKIAQSNLPREFSKVSMPDYVVEPPDLLTRRGPRGPARPADLGRAPGPARRQDLARLLRRGLRRRPDDHRDQGEDRPPPPQVHPRRGARAGRA